MKSFTFHTPPALISQPGALGRLGELCRARGIRRPLIVTDPGIVKLGMLERLVDVLKQVGCEPMSFSEVVADPPERVVLSGVAKARALGVDAVIGFGGGSSMDSAKLVALIAKSGERLADIYGVDRVKGERLPLMLVPTTAGTGSEVTAVAIVSTGETTKMGVVSSRLFPDIAVLDAELTLGLPPHITAMTGVDAMVHATEAYTSLHKKNPYSDMLAREALRLMSGSLETAVKDGRNLEARQAMLLGACLAGQAFANAPVAAVHALAYPLGGHYHLPHGLTNALVLPQVLLFNAPAAVALYAELAEVVIPSSELVKGTEARCGQFIDYLVDLMQVLELPATLREMDIPEADLPMLAADAMKQQRLLQNNPREVTEADALAIYRAAYDRS